MRIIRRLLTPFPSYKWCGCKSTVPDEKSYQFRVKARTEDTDENLFQIREKRVCQQCNEETVDVIVENTCTYDPHMGIHERRVGVDEEDMRDYGFLDQDKFARLLIEMRLSHSLNPDLSSE